MGGSENKRIFSGNKRILRVCSRRLGVRTNLESDKHAGKPGAFANGVGLCGPTSMRRGMVTVFVASSAGSSATGAPNAASNAAGSIFATWPLGNGARAHGGRAI